MTTTYHPDAASAYCAAVVAAVTLNAQAAATAFYSEEDKRAEEWRDNIP